VLVQRRVEPGRLLLVGSCPQRVTLFRVRQTPVLVGRGQDRVKHDVLTHSTASRAQDKLTPAEAKAIGKDAFLWGMHPVAIYHMR
jgi:hypothetical protein